MVCFMKIRERRRMHEFFIDSMKNVRVCRLWGLEELCITCLCLLYVHVSIPRLFYPTYTDLPHIYGSTPHLWVYPMYMCLLHVNVSTPRTCVYPAYIGLPHVHVSTPRTYVYPTYICPPHIHVSIPRTCVYPIIYPASIGLLHVYEYVVWFTCLF